MDPQHHAHAGQRATVHELVDALLEHARSEHPDITEWSVTLSQSESLLVPRDSDKLFRVIDGIPGYYNGHVYSSDITRGLDVLKLTDPRLRAAERVTYDEFNPQTQPSYRPGR